MLVDTDQSFYQLCIFIQALFACAMSAFRYNQTAPLGHYRSRDCMLASPSNIHISHQSSKAVSHANNLSQAEQIPQYRDVRECPCERGSAFCPHSFNKTTLLDGSHPILATYIFLLPPTSSFAAYAWKAMCCASQSTSACPGPQTPLGVPETNSGNRAFSYFPKMLSDVA